jgi:hypothetical protein
LVACLGRCRDLKPQNVLVNANCELVICDFGLARAIGRRVDEATEDPMAEAAAGGDLTSYVVTRWYRAPELLCGAGMYDAAVDMWAVGCILAEILGRRALFPGRNFNHMMQLIVDCLGTPTDEAMWFVRSDRVRGAIRKLGRRAPVDLRRLYPHANPQALDLIRHMLVFDPSKRISVVEALAHPYLADYHYPDDEPAAPSVVEFPFDKLGALSKAYLQAKMVAEMMSQAEDVKDKPPPTSRVPVAAPAPAAGGGDAAAAADADADASASSAAAAADEAAREAERARAKAMEDMAAKAEAALKQQRADEERQNALAAERRQALMGAMGAGADTASARRESAASAPPRPPPAAATMTERAAADRSMSHNDSKHSLHGADHVSAEAAAGMDRSAGTGRLSAGLDGALTAPEVEAKINARVTASEARTQEAIRRAVAEALAPMLARMDRLEKAVDAVAGGSSLSSGGAAASAGGDGGLGSSTVRFAPSSTPESRPPAIRAGSKDHVQFAGVDEGGHRAYPRTPAPELGAKAAGFA